MFSANVVAHGNSAEPVVVRAIDHDNESHTYTFKCDIPDTAGDVPVTWSIRTSNPACTIHEVQSYDHLLEWSPLMLSDEQNFLPECQGIGIVEEDLMHFGCQVVYFPAPDYQQQLLRGDFHIELRTEEERLGQYDHIPNVVAHQAYDLFVDVECIPPTGHNSDVVSWIFIHPATGTVDSFSDAKRISRTLPYAGLWDFACEVAGTRYDLPVEFFDSGPAYIADKWGCVPGEICYLDDDFHIEFPGPSWVGPAQNQEGVEPYHFNLNVYPLDHSDFGPWVSSDFEIRDTTTNTLVWSTYTVDTTHVRNGDGTFVGLLSGMDRLEYNTPYHARARYHTTQATSDWNEWRYFTTRPQSESPTEEFTWTARDGYKVELVSSEVNMPVMIRRAPDMYSHLAENERPLLYVTQLYGQIGVILQDGTYLEYANNLLNYQSFGTLPGSGEMGVTGLYVDDGGDVFASFVNYDYSSEEFFGQVDRFHTNSEGTGYTHRTTVITDIPVSPAHQVQDIVRGPDGMLYIGTGDADDPQGAATISNLYGKILRMHDDGTMPNDNPFAGTYVYAAGLRNPFSMDFEPHTGRLLVSNNGEDSNDGLYAVSGGETFGWCRDGVCDSAVDTWHLWPQSVVPTATRFDYGTSVFPQESKGSLYVVLHGPTVVPGTLERGKRIVEIKVNPDGSAQEPVELLRYSGDGFGTPLGLEFASDGLYFTDFLGEEGFVGLGQSHGNIYRIVPGVQTEDPAPHTDGFRAGLGAAPWFPQGLNMIWECRGSGGSGNYLYSYWFGDGHQQLLSTYDNVWHTYEEEGVYEARCVVYDVVTSESTSVTTMLNLGNIPDNGGPPVDVGETPPEEPTPPPPQEPDASCTTLATSVASCGAGSITYDVMDGSCRTIICDHEGNSMSVLACEKPDSGEREYFEMYRQLQFGDAIEVCIGSTCIKNNGFAKSPQYVCDGTPPVIPDNGGTPDNNDTQPEVSVSIAPWFPQDRSYVFVCESHEFSSATYDWNFGDGHAQWNTARKDVYHTYDAVGLYDVSCTARSASQVSTGTLQVVVE